MLRQNSMERWKGKLERKGQILLIGYRASGFLFLKSIISGLLSWSSINDRSCLAQTDASVPCEWIFQGCANRESSI
ncbi:hypothetical protein Hypma_012106 [Hypsizygus marmoreus]|uniref:Uncharacterized protein n=1 Tax=Hypsizygus marmoreus TaxID=39966 RepID=A0A369JFJ0_HYPMA|nr:hypothetical protein Hypma_012106 [Hypsizygus marmoreus]